MESVLNYCPRCGRSDIDRDRHGSPGIGVCRDCGTLFSILSVRLGEKVIPLGTATGLGGSPVETSVPGEPIREAASARPKAGGGEDV